MSAHFLLLVLPESQMNTTWTPLDVTQLTPEWNLRRNPTSRTLVLKTDVTFCGPSTCLACLTCSPQIKALNHTSCARTTTLTTSHTGHLNRQNYLPTTWPSYSNYKLKLSDSFREKLFNSFTSNASLTSFMVKLDPTLDCWIGYWWNMNGSHSPLRERFHEVI